MKKLLFTVALVIAFASPVSAKQCPKDMAAIDAAMASASLSKEDTAKVKELRAKGEKLHKSGGHGESVKALGEAKMLLGLKSM